MDDRTGTESGIAESTRALNQSVRVEPQVDVVFSAGEVEEVLAEVGLKGNPVGLQLGLQTVAFDLEVQLSILFETNTKLIVFNTGGRTDVQLDGRRAAELAVELNLVIGRVVILEKRCLVYRLPSVSRFS